MKSAYKGLRSKLRDSHGPQQLENGLDSTLDKPRSAPNSPTGKRRTSGFSIPTTTYRKDTSFKNPVTDRLVNFVSCFGFVEIYFNKLIFCY